MRFTWSVFFLLFLGTGPLLSQTDSVRTRGPQLSYSLNLFNPVGNFIDLQGASIDVEARVHKRFSLLATLGRTQSVTSTSWAGLPLPLDANKPLPPFWPSERLPGPIPQTTRRLYLGAGLQLNVRIGSGDLALSGILTGGQNRLRQSVTFGNILVPTAPGNIPPVTGAPRGLFGTATIKYRGVIQLGTLIQLHYTHWFSRNLALRVGTSVHSFGLVTWGDYRDGSPARYRVRKIEYDSEYRPGIDNYPLPAEESFLTPDPTDHEFHFMNVNFGIVFKPQKRSS